jgi:hypothetical protein
MDGNKYRFWLTLILWIAVPGKWLLLLWLFGWFD